MLAQFDKVNDREREIKRAQLTMLLELRKKLTDDQRTKLAQLRPQQANPGAPSQALREKVERVKAGATKWQSEGRDPAPIPKSSRPFETMSTVVAILANIAGGRNRLLVTRSPTRKRSVWAARAESSVHPSKIGPLGSPPIGIR